MPKAAKKKKITRSKEASRKEILKFYDRRQYRKALRMCDQVISQTEDHGEALSLRGLTHSQLDEKDKALADANAGLRKDVKSFLCWNVLGIIHRGRREWALAAKYYKGALRNDPPQKSTILRDLATVQIHSRDVKGYLASRHEMVMESPKQGSNWMGYAVAAHLCGHYEQALKILDAYSGIINRKHGEVDMDYSELLMYRNVIYREMGDLDRALADLRENRFDFTDKALVSQLEAELLIKLGKPEEAQTIYNDLLDKNPENVEYHRGLAKAMGLDPAEDGTYTADQIEKLTALYDDLQGRLPKWSTVTRGMPLFFKSGEALRTALDAYIRPALVKGQPALHSTIAPLYSDEAKVALLEELLLSYLNGLKENGRFPGADEDAPPSALVWVLLFLGHHYRSVGKYEDALQCCDQAIEHTPTALEAYMCKAKVFKTAGALRQAAITIDEARKLDLADRFLNSKCARYMFRANRIDEAEVVATLFTKAENNGNNLFDMQCTWYEQECGEALRRVGKRGRALKQFLDIEKHFDTILEDQWDFHSYCLRKATMSAYVTMLRFEDQLYSHPKIFAALTNVVEIYVDLYDNPVYEDLDCAVPADLDKKEKSEFKRALARRKAEHEEKVKAMDKDELAGHALEWTATPLEDSLKWLDMILTHHKDEVRTHKCAFEVHIRRKKFLLALRAVKHAVRLAPNSGVTHEMVARFFLSYDNRGETDVHAITAKLVEIEREALMGGGDVTAFTDRFIAQNNDLPSSLAHLKVLNLIDKDRAKSFAANVASRELKREEIKTWKEVHQVVKGIDEELADQVFAAGAAACALEDYFHPSTTDAAAEAAAASAEDAGDSDGGVAAGEATE